MTESDKTFMERFNALRDEMKAPKNCRNNFGGYNYRNLEGIQEALKPLAVKWQVTINGKDDLVEMCGRLFYKSVYTAMDSTGQDATVLETVGWAEHPASKKGMDPAQLTGAVSSYARKYALGGLLMLDDTEDADSSTYQPAPAAQPSRREQMLARIEQLANEASANGVRRESVDEWLQAKYGTNNKADLTDAQLTELGKHLAQVAKDSKTLKKEN